MVIPPMQLKIQITCIKIEYQDRFLTIIATLGSLLVLDILKLLMQVKY